MYYLASITSCSLLLSRLVKVAWTVAYSNIQQKITSLKLYCAGFVLTRKQSRFGGKGGGATVTRISVEKDR